MRWTVIFTLLVFIFMPSNARAECLLASSGETRSKGAIIYNADHDVLQVCQSGGEWQALTRIPDPCLPSRNPAPGTVCDDKTVYAGTHGGSRMFVPPTDQASDAYWGAYGFETGVRTSDGEANTQMIYDYVQAGEGSWNPDDGRTPNAAVLCQELDAYGYDDWFLPGLGEISRIYNNRDAIGGFSTVGFVHYWISYEDSGNPLWWALYYAFNSGAYIPDGKSDQKRVRCVRKE